MAGEIQNPKRNIPRAMFISSIAVGLFYMVGTLMLILSSNFVLADLSMPAADLAALRDYLFAFPTETPSIVGQQVTLSAETAGTAGACLDLLASRARVTAPVPECELVARGVVQGQALGWLLQADGRFQGDRAGEESIPRAELERMATAPGVSVTFTCAPGGPGWG